MKKLTTPLYLCGAVAAAFALYGCGGSNNGTARPAVAEGTYYGVDLDANNPPGGDAGLVQISVAGGKVELSFNQLGGSQTNYEGTISGKKAKLSVVSGTTSTSTSTGGATGPDTIGLTFAQNAATKVLTASFTTSNETTGTLTAGAITSVLLPLPVTYSGTYSSSSGDSGTLSVTIDSDTISGSGTSSTGATFPVTGAIDTNGVLYLAYNRASGYENAVSTSSTGNLSSTANYTLSEVPSGQTLQVTMTEGTGAQPQQSLHPGHVQKVSSSLSTLLMGHTNAQKATRLSFVPTST